MAENQPIDEDDLFGSEEEEELEAPTATNATDQEPRAVDGAPDGDRMANVEAESRSASQSQHDSPRGEEEVEDEMGAAWTREGGRGG